MSVPDPIGPVHYSEPRAVRIRLRDEKEPHSAVHGDMNIEVESMKEASAVIAAWPVVMRKAADEFQATLSEMRKVEQN